MAVVMKRSTKIAPESLSTSYLIGSAFMGISMTTLNASGMFLPGETLSRDMVLSEQLRNGNAWDKPSFYVGCHAGRADCRLRHPAPSSPGMAHCTGCVAPALGLTLVWRPRHCPQGRLPAR